MLGPSTNRIYGDEHLGRPPPAPGPGGARGTIGPKDGAVPGAGSRCSRDHYNRVRTRLL